jgi:O-antigen/teichoic acid export membrane protein
MSGVRPVFRHALIFGLAPVLQKLIALLLLPYFTHYLDEDQYGLRDLLVAVTGLFPVLFTFEYRTGFIRSYVGLETSAARAELFTATFKLMTLLAVLAAGSFCLFWEPIFRFAHAPPVSDFFRLVLTAGIFLDVLTLTLASAAQAELWSAKMLGLNLLQFTLGVLLNIQFVVVQELGALGLFLGYALSSTVYLLGLVWITRGLFVRHVPLLRSLAICRPSLVYSLPLWGGSLAYFVVRYVERIIIPGVGSLGSLGVYGIAWKLSNMLGAFLLEPFLRSFDVWRFKVFAEGGEVAVIADCFRWFMLALGAAALALSTFGIDLFLGLADERYAGAAAYIPWLNVAVLLQCAYSISASAFFVAARTGTWMALFVGAALLQVCACSLLIPAFGPLGAPLAMIGTNAFLYAGTILFGATLWRVPYRHGLALGVILLATALSFVRQELELDTWLAAGTADALLLATFAGCALLARWVSLAELREGWGQVRGSILTRIAPRSGHRPGR